MKDCCCDFRTMEQVHDDLDSMVKDLVHTTYFKYYHVKEFFLCLVSSFAFNFPFFLFLFLFFLSLFGLTQVNLHAKCPFWNDEHHCFLEDCSVKECDEVPLHLFVPISYTNPSKMAP